MMMRLQAAQAVGHDSAHVHGQADACRRRMFGAKRHEQGLGLGRAVRASRGARRAWGS